MRLIGGHDYYDGAGWGVDQDSVFVRQNAMRLKDAETIEDHPFKTPATIELRPHQNSFGTLTPIIVVVAGERYAGLCEQITHCGGLATDNETRRYHFGIEAGMAALEAHMDHIRYWRYIFDELLSSKKLLASRFEDFFSRSITSEQLDWVLDNRVTILSTTRQRGSSRDKRLAYVDHACLKDQQFYTCLDAPTIHMRISNFVSGVLPQDRETVTLSDTDKIRKAGFDTKLSFRKGPEKSAAKHP